MQLESSYPLDAVAPDAVEGLPEKLGVIQLDLAQAAPYVGRARNLRRRLPRLRRLFGDRVLRARYQPVGSSFEAKILLWRLGRHVWPDRYRERLRLRPAILVKALQNNRFCCNIISSFNHPFRFSLFSKSINEVNIYCRFSVSEYGL